MTEASNIENDKKAFDDVIRVLHAEAYSVGVQLSWDARERLIYAKKISDMSNDLRVAAKSGRITWAQAAQQANEARNLIMQYSRWRTTPYGRSLAQQLKREGATLNSLIANRTVKLYGSSANFDRLSLDSKNTVYFEVVRSAGKSNPNANARLERLTPAARGLVFISMSLSVYAIATADNKVQAAKKEAAILGAGIGGGVLGGATAGLICGPASPVCVGVGAFVGGALAGLGVGWIW